MARYLSNIDLAGNELQNALVQPAAGAPTALGDGHLYYNTTSDTLVVRANGAWADLAFDSDLTSHTGDSTIHFTVASIDHGSIAGLGDDDHSQYLLLLGRAGGQDIIGGTAASNNLTLESTSNVTKGFIQLKDTTRLTTAAAGSFADAFVVRDSAAGELQTVTPSGTPSGTTFLRGDGTWATPAGGFANFLAGADTGTDVTINDGDLLEVLGGSGLTSTVADVGTTTTITVDLDINSLATETTIAAGDFVPFWDITATATNKKLTFANFETALNHDSLTGFVANEHIDHSSVTLTLTGTANEIEITGAAQDLTSNLSFTIGLPNDVTIGNSLTVTGNLIVNGTTTTVNSSTLTVDDPLIKVGDGNTATDVVDLGIYWEYAIGGPATRWGGITRDATDGIIKFFELETVEPTTTTTFGTLADISFGTVQSGTWNGTAIGIAYGGTGLTGTPTNGQLLIGNGSGYSLATLTDGNAINITEGSGTITIAAVSASTTAEGVVEQATQAEVNTGTDTARYITPATLRGTPDISLPGTNVSTRKYAATVGDGASTSIAVTHNLGTRQVVVQLFKTATPYDTVYCDIDRNTTNQVTLGFGSAPASGEYTVVIMG